MVNLPDMLCSVWHESHSVDTHSAWAPDGWQDDAGRRCGRSPRGRTSRT